MSNVQIYLDGKDLRTLAQRTFYTMERSHDAQYPAPTLMRNRYKKVPKSDYVVFAYT